MGIEFTDAQKDFVRRNFGTMRTVDIAATLGCCTSTVLNLKNKLNCASKGNKKKGIDLNYYKNKFKKGKCFKLKTNIGKYIKIKIFTGVVTDVTDHLVVFKDHNGIKTSFTYKDFATGVAIILEEVEQ